MAYEFAARPEGRDALHSVEIVFETQQQSSRRGRRVVVGLDCSLAEVLWSRYWKSPDLGDLGDWAKKIGVSRPGWGNPNAFYLTAEVLENSLRDNPPPRPLEHVELARLIILFAAVLPRDEGLSLMRTAITHGIAVSELAKPNSAAVDIEVTNPLESSQQSHGAWSEAFPTLAERPPLVLVPAPLPTSGYEAKQLAAEISRVADAVMECEKQVNVNATIGTLLGMDGSSYLHQTAAIESARSSRVELATAVKRGQDFVAGAVSAVSGRMQLGELTWLADTINNPSPSEVAGAVIQADNLAHLSVESIDAGVARHWLPEAKAAKDLTALVSAFRELPSRQTHFTALASHERNYVASVRTYISEEGPGTTELIAWLRRLSISEIMALLDNLDHVQWPLVASVLTRLAIDGGPEGVSACAARIVNVADRKIRRDLLHFVDSSSSALDNVADFLRVVIAERLRDTLDYAPLVTITDPSLRLKDVGLVGSPIANLVDLLIHHLDLIGNSAELRRLAASGGQDCTGLEGISSELISYATTATGSSGLYLQLREAVRESWFLPLVKSGELDHSAVISLANSFDVDDAIENAVAEVRRNNNRLARIEPRHRARVQRYVQNGKDLLESYSNSQANQSQTRRKEFRGELLRALESLNDEPAPIGSHQWLEGEVRGILLQPLLASESRTLLGDSRPVLDQPWTVADTAWAIQAIRLSDFFTDAGTTVRDVVAKVFQSWGADRKPDACEIVRELLVTSQVQAARSFVEEEMEDGPVAEDLRDIIGKAAEELLFPLRDRLHALSESQGQEFIRSFETHAEIVSSIEGWRFSEAAEQLDFLEMEVAERIEAEHRDRLNASQASERNAIIRRLLLAGVEGPDERWALADLESRWAVEFAARSGMRAHLRVVEKALEASDTIPELAEDARAFSSLLADPNHWLPEVRAEELFVLVEGPADKLRTWLQLAEQLDETQRCALVGVTRFLVRFVDEIATALRALDSGADSDPILESAMEVEYAFDQSADPIACAQGLDVPFEEAVPLTVQEPPHTYDERQIREILTPLAEKGEWLALAESARDLRMNSSDEEARRLVDVAEFADTLCALMDGRISVAREGLVTSAKVLGASGHFISHTLSPRRQQAIAFDLLVAALGTDDAGIKAIAPQTDGAWLPLVDKRWGLLQSLRDGSLGSRVLEQLCSGTFGREVVNRLWDAPTSTAEPGPLRAALLKFLHERGLNEHILFLAARHEPSLQARLGQLLNLRKIVSQRPDLLPVSEAVASQVAKAAQGVPFRTFVQDLPTAAQTVDADLVVTVDNDIVLRIDRKGPTELSVAISVAPRGMVPESLEVILFTDDDVTFDDNTRRRMLAVAPVYFPTEYNVGVRFGESWNDAASRTDVNFKVRVNARVLAGELISRDVVCQVTRNELQPGKSRRIDDETLLDTFPGVENTPAAGNSFVGRVEELERLHGALVSARRPSPVLLTGMRRIGKTSLLYKFHDRYRQPKRDAPLTVYFTLAERRAPMMDPNQSVSGVFFSSIAQALGKRNFSSTDLNRDLGEKLRQALGGDRDAVRNAIMELRDPDSLADSLIVLSERLLEWAGGASRVIYLIDEAETLVLPYKGSEAKRLELQQLMQGLREVSQTSNKVGLLLSGSNHIAEFARSYKNAFFGSSLQIDLAGMTDLSTASKLVSPDKLKPYIAFSGDPVRYAIDMCAGMPQFLWHLGAACAAIVRSGPVTKADVRHGVSSLIGVSKIDLPFTAYDVLEPIEHMLGLQGQREQDLLWLALWRVANSSSLVANEAQLNYIVDHSLLELDELEGWKGRLLSLVDLEILEVSKSSMFKFRVPIFAEGFRAPRREHDYYLRHQRAAT